MKSKNKYPNWENAIRHNELFERMPRLRRAIAKKQEGV